MAETGIWQGFQADAGFPADAAEDRVWRARSAGGGRAGLRLWTWLHAQALLQGTIVGGPTGGGPAEGAGDVACIEDDRRRLAGRRLAGR